MKSNFSAVALALCTVCFFAHAQPAYPQKPITIVVPFPPGGGPDKLARVIGEKLAIKLGQPVLVDNRAGASGTIGAAFVAKAAPDGYTLMMTPNTFVLSSLVLPKSVVNYDVQGSFAPVSIPSKALLVLAAHPSLGVKTLPELVQYAKKNRGVSYTGSASGSPMHVAGEMMKLATGIDMVFVPYKGLIPAITDTISGHVKLVFGTYGTLAPHLKSGRLIAIGGLASEPPAFASAIVPLSKQGYPTLVAEIWNGLFAPIGTPQPIIELLNREINTILTLPDVKEKLEGTGEVLLGGPPDALARAVKTDLDVFGAVVRSAHITAE
jgi:tripartite-type tricarboxylate transporter receptor subunit TctC